VKHDIIRHKATKYDILRKNVIISKTVMNDVPSAPISDFENTLSFRSEETSLGSPEGKKMLTIRIRSFLEENIDIFMNNS
jgi:hypothetical protein